ncbi:non-ribosomal peptide synthetase [Flavobacterium sp. ov086]|uniref:non-ribosomal peptide synthetase n=1 Tax=Flavobacterium sp. ov086 TaxID=1761785 RepID=UPI000B6CD64E|nr:non-ribosomal peptide synthetase [Flavobacterium sp. ov086]SNS01129.1 amino acid adenylation domain-containing protein [Flavobacterium sp. ov086]
MSSLDGVTQCCVLAKEDAVGSKRLVGYVVLEDTLDKERLQNQLKLSLPEYMVPQLWVTLDAMPLTGNGKLDKKSLPNPDSSELSSKEYVAPRNETETQLAEIWQNLLGLGQVGIHDNFFELGGHSLLATRLVSMIRKELRIEVSIREVFEHTTISGLGTHISAQSEGVLLPGIFAEDRPTRIPLSFSQERLWFLDQLQGSTEYHVPSVLRLEGALDISILEQTLQEIVSRHEVLRSLLLSEDGIGYQEIISAESWSLDQLEIEDALMLESSLQDYLMRPFDLSKDYKLRSCLYGLGNNQYVLANVFHHIASDGWSEGILVKEFMELYGALQSGRPAVLPELNLQYADYAIWQRKYLEGEVLDNQLSYWQAKLRGVSTLSLPTDHVRPSIQSNEGASVSLELEKELSDSLSSICQKEGVTLFMFMLSAFKVLLSRYSGQDDICVGTPIANRTQSELEGMIGFFINTLALRSDLSGDPSFKDVLARVKETTLEGYDHQLTPFEKVVDRVVTTRDMSMTPLFQVMFRLQNILKDNDLETKLKEVKLSSYDYEEVATQFDLNLFVKENDLGISLELVYCKVLFYEETITSMLRHYQELLRSIVDDVTQTIGNLSMLTEYEEKQLVDNFNATNINLPKGFLHTPLLKKIEEIPDKIAVITNYKNLSYKELGQRSLCLAGYLYRHHVRPNVPVAVLMHKGWEEVVAVLGILRSGAAYLPIDASLPSLRINQLLKLAEVSQVITTSEVLDNLELDECYNTYVIKPDEWDTQDSLIKVPHICSPSDLAYIIFTSGSTGVPKGVMIDHQGALNTIQDINQRFEISENDSVLGLSRLNFDLSVYDIFGVLGVGGQLILPAPDEYRNPQSWLQYCQKYSITIWNTVPALMQIFMDYIEDNHSRLSLQTVLMSGDWIPTDLPKRIRSSCLDVKVYSLGGATEASIWSIFYPIEIDVTDLTSIPYGKPLGNQKIYLLTKELQAVPVGVIGDLYIGGIGVALGYWKDQEKTHKSFFTHEKLGRIYRTGDQGYHHSNGNIIFMGRKDDQVKIRGYRIELGEIENVLLSLLGVTQCCVLAKEDTKGVKHLVGYVVLEGALDKEYLQENLKFSLPEYMVPMIWVELEEMPLTSNGKLDKKALPEMDSLVFSVQEYVAPRNETEEKLVAIWQDLLGVEQVGVNDNFFELGGHSLLATRLVSMIRKEFESEITIKDVFEFTRIEELSTYLRHKEIKEKENQDITYKKIITI